MRKNIIILTLTFLMPFSSLAQIFSWYNSAVLKTHASTQTIVRN